MPKWYIEANALMDYACNQKGKTIAPNDIARFPKADAQEVKHGKWLHSDYILNRSVCSVCKFVTDDIDSAIMNFCPNCGAKMDEKEKEKIDDTDSKASV